jgi:hypothetical protein
MPLLFAQARAPARSEPPMLLCMSFTWSHSAVFSALSCGTIFGIMTKSSVASVYTPMLALPMMLVK